MQHRQYTTQQIANLVALPDHWKRFVRVYYGVNEKQNIVHVLASRHVNYKDLVLMLARRSSTTTVLGHLINRPVHMVPAVRLCYRVNGMAPAKIRRRPACWRDGTITYIDKTVSRLYGHRLRKRCTPRDLHKCGVPWRSLQRFFDDGNLRVM